MEVCVHMSVCVCLTGYSGDKKGKDKCWNQGQEIKLDKTDYNFSHFSIDW